MDDAIAAYDTALRLRPAFPEALRAGGTVLRDRGAGDAALRFFSEAIRLRPAYLDAILDKGNLLHGLGRFDEAVATFDAALRVLPNDAALLCNKGTTLHSLGRLPEACIALEQAVTADPSLAQAYLNHAGVLMRMFRHAEALPILDRAIALQPIYAAAHANRGLTLKLLGRFEEAALALDTALAQSPGDVYALTNRGELRLLLGDYEQGLVDYESRFSIEWHELPALRISVPRWSGEPLSGLRIVATADAGSGDVINFARYIPMLAAAGAVVTVLCRSRLQRLLKPVFGVRVVDADDGADEFDHLVPFSSLPFVCGQTVATITGLPYLAAEPDLVETWRTRLGDGGYKIGLCWRGSQDWRADPNRSISLEAFAPLAALPGVRLISLLTDADIEPSIPIERFNDVDAGPDGFIDTAAIMANLDLIVTIDTSIAHLAGALGRPTAVLLRKVPEWRWLLNRDDTPWYSTMRLFRQETTGSWTAPIARLVGEVEARLRQR